MRRESYSNRFATALEGADLDQPGVALDRTGHENPVPRSFGPIRRTRPVAVRDVEFLRSLTDRQIKIAVPGPFTMTQQAQNDHYADDRSLALAYAEAVNESYVTSGPPARMWCKSRSRTCRRGRRRRGRRHETCVGARQSPHVQFEKSGRASGQRHARNARPRSRRAGALPDWLAAKKR